MATDTENYAKLIKSIYGAESPMFAELSQETNNVIGAINRGNNFSEFATHFTNRLERLAEFCRTSNEHIPFIHKAVREIASPRNWDGAYAELAALDYFVTSVGLGPQDIQFDKQSKASDTLASEMGMSNVDHDFYLPAIDGYFDVKILSDKSGQLLSGIVKEVLARLSIAGLKILHFAAVDVSYFEIQQNRNDLVEELASSFASGTRPSRVQSQIVASVEFQPVWESAVYFSENTYSAELHADRHHSLLFQHAKKFHRHSPSLIVFVHFPWASEAIYDRFGKETFYRDLAQNFYVANETSDRTANEFNSKFTTNVSADWTSKNLAGVVFLDDDCILGNSGSLSKVDASLCMNDRYLFPLKAHSVEAFLKGHAANIGE